MGTLYRHWTLGEESNEKGNTVGGHILLVLVVIGAGTRFYFVYSPSPGEPKLSSTIRHETMKAGGRERSVLTYVPATLPPG